MVEPVTIGAIAGGVLGAAFIAILVTWIIFLCRRLKRRTNSRTKLVTSDGEVHKEKWVKKYKERPGGVNNKQLYFGDVQTTEHVVVKEKRKQDVVVTPPRRVIIPPPPPLPLPTPQPTPLRTRRVYRSLPRNQPPPSFRRRPSFSAERPAPAPYFMYGLPYGHPNTAMMTSNSTYGTYIQQNATQPPAPEPAPQPQPAPAPTPAPQPQLVVMDREEVKPKSIEEQERVLVIDEMTDKTFNPRWQGRVQQDSGHTAASQGGSATASYEYCFTTHLTETEIPQATTKDVPRIVTEVI